VTLREAVAWRRRAREAGVRVVFTNGCFDILHRGHVTLLREAARLGDRLVVGLNSDRSVAGLKGPGRPLLPQGERAEILSAIRWVDAVVIFEEETPLRLIERLRPDVLVKGGDYRAEEVVGSDVVREGGGEVVIVPYVAGHSTSRLIRAMRNCGEGGAG
jgi:D-beta-D-heptose 7-phosphate kinase/D-beta-D-heptose 1-phosphate adenosyltransferase